MLEMCDEYDGAEDRDAGRGKRECQNSTTGYVDDTQQALRKFGNEPIFEYTDENSPQTNRPERCAERDRKRHERTPRRVVSAHEQKHNPLRGKRKRKECENRSGKTRIGPVESATSQYDTYDMRAQYDDKGCC